ncbi:MAG TPA: cytochrome c maturation protein CcmE, partial [Thermoleophilaceae bacterium]|nr:cytochrome c maturation protein CcmE [Thermoleophilaceae bacterium]
SGRGGPPAIIWAVDPGRKRTLRLGIALGVASLLAAALLYVSFSATPEALSPSDVLAASASGESYKVTGKVVKGSVEREEDGLSFEVRDREGTAAVPVSYSGLVPDPFREGREVIVSGRMQDGTLVVQEDELVTKCPSKFKNGEEASS